MAWKKVVTESDTNKIAQEAASLLNQGALATLGAVDSAQITNGSIDTAHIANDQITSALMANDAVSGEIIADEGISQGKLADNSVQTNTIEAASITLAKMASESVDEDNLLISNNPTNGQFLSAQSGNAGGLTWAVPTDISNLNALTDTTIDGTPADGEVLVFDTTNKWQNQTLAETGIQPLITGAATTIDTENLTASVAMVTDASGKVAVSAVTATELGYVDGVTSAIQTQLDAKQASGTYYTDALNATYWQTNASRTIGNSGATLTVAGDLVVSGDTITANVATITVEDKNIQVANGASSLALASGAGLTVSHAVVGTAKPELQWIDAGNTLTGWSINDNNDTAHHEIAVMGFSTADATGNGAGVGSFHYDTSGDNLWLRTS